MRPVPTAVRDWEQALAAAVGSLPATLATIAQLRSTIIDLQDLLAIVESKALSAMPGDRLESDGLFALRLPGTRRYTNWDDREVVRRLVADSGSEAATSLPKAADVLLRAARPVWRTSVLRKSGVRFDDLVDVVVGRPRLLVRTETS